jgi:hypothetical protein
MTFLNPDFSTGAVELRLKKESGNNEVCVYATKDGIKRLISLLEDLLRAGKDDHIHLEDYELLTKESLKGVFAVFQ